MSADMDLADPLGPPDAQTTDHDADSWIAAGNMSLRGAARPDTTFLYDVDGGSVMRVRRSATSRTRTSAAEEKEFPVSADDQVVWTMLGPKVLTVNLCRASGVVHTVDPATGEPALIRRERQPSPDDFAAPTPESVQRTKSRGCSAATTVLVVANICMVMLIVYLLTWTIGTST